MNLKNILHDSLPTYITTLPYSKVKTKFRPFLVKEEKKLLILEETSNKKEKVLITFSHKTQKIKIKIYSLSKIPNGMPGEGTQPWTFIDEISIQK